MAGYTFFHTLPISSVRELAERGEHNLRQEGERTPEHIDKERMDENRILVGSWDDDIVSQYRDEIRNSEYYATHDVRKNAIVGGELLFNYPGGPDDKNQRRMDEWVETTKEWVLKNFGQENVKSIVLHMDEATPHIHALFIPMYENAKGDRKLSYSKYIDGPAHLGRLQTDYADSLENLGFKRGVKYSPARNQTLKEVHTVIHKAFGQDAPEIAMVKNKFGKDVPETAEQYRERVNQEWKELYAKASILENDMTRSGDIREAASRKDRTIEELQNNIEQLQTTVAGLEGELYEHRKRDQLIRHGIEISPDKNMKDLVDRLENTLIEDATRDYEKNNVNIDDILK